MKYIVGPSNPGEEYSLTKQNVGFITVREKARSCGVDIDQKLYGALLGRGRIKGEGVVFLMPQTYMNLSGKSVGDLFRREMKSIDDLIVICDDINLKLGRIRIRKKGSAGGHKGLASIIDELNNSDFTRLRVGIATEVHKGDISGYVLTPFKRKDHKHVQHVVSLAKDAVLYWIKNGTEKTMTKFNTVKVGTS